MEKKKPNYKKFLIASTVLASVASLAAIGGVTYAGYIRSEAIKQPATIGRYLFLNPAIGGDATGWEKDVPGVAFYLFVYNVESESITKEELVRSSENKLNGRYYFYVSSTWTYCRFVRASALYPAETIEAHITGAASPRTCTGDNTYLLNITIEKEIPPQTNKNYYNLSSWNDGDFATS